MINEKLKELIYNDEEKIIEQRRKLHQNPELSMEEKETNDFIKKELESYGLEVKQLDSTGLIADINPESEGKTVLLRADFDALPIQETNDFDFKSKNAGKSHACGHDTHTAMLLAATRALLEIKDELPGKVRLLFQPGEETGDGGKAVVKQGVTKGVDSGFAIHIFTNIPLGYAATGYDQVMAGNYFFEVNFKGKSAHGSTPFEGHDAIMMLNSFINGANGAVARKVDALNEPIVLNYGTISGGSVANAVASEAKLVGSFRFFSNESADKFLNELKEIADLSAKLYGGSCEFTYNQGAGPVINEKTSTDTAVKVARDLFGEDKVMTDMKVAGSEDFGFLLAGYDEFEGMPGAYMCIGAMNPEDPSTFPINHAQDFNPDERAFKDGALLLAQYAYEFLKQDNE
ncbi:M20 family metallopeptidase [uncultured Anaerococcus sp.]|uniref:M20 metallopeptidase family protein n=1 Tax=uncultured Anaerococcus sp. TaxID=293428 RepID=UPI002600006B|nr:amidohydrolase [uncultured Anaerococcus sp.]